jgi:hypothetical protein
MTLLVNATLRCYEGSQPSLPLPLPHCLSNLLAVALASQQSTSASQVKSSRCGN